MILDTKGREVGEQGRVPDRVKSTRYVSEYGSDFMSSIENLHPLLGKQKQHIQGRVTWSESKLMIGNQAIGEEEGCFGADAQEAEEGRCRRLRDAERRNERCKLA